METSTALAQRLVLVTGAYGGLGRAVSLACARAGATVVVVGRVVRRLEALYDEILSVGAPEPVIHPMDFATADTNAYAEVAAALHGQFGRLDGLVHTAATVGTVAPIEHQSAEGWLTTYRVNTVAAFALTRACSPLLRASGDAAVIFTLDSRGQEPRAYWGGYAASKAALAAFFTELADEWEHLANIRVEAVVPGPMNSPIRRRTYPAEDAEQHPMPERIAPLFVELLAGGSASRRGRAVDAHHWLESQPEAAGPRAAGGPS